MDRALLEQVVSAYLENDCQVRRTARQLGVHQSTVTSRLAKARDAGMEVPEPSYGRANRRGIGRESFDVDRESDRTKIDSRQFDIRTPEDAIKAAGVDLSIWRVTRSKVSKSQVLRREDESPRDLWHVQVWFDRAVTLAEENAVDLLVKRLGGHRAEKVTPPKHRRNDPYMLEWSPFDAHFGKLAWAPETGDDYDLEIAERRFQGSLEYALRHMPDPGQCQLIVAPVGSDFLHFDNAAQETTAGTPQDSDGRWAKVFACAQMAMVRAIDAALQVAPVRLVWVRGNHDEVASWHVARFLAAWYRGNKSVEVDDAPTPRKYVEFGDGLLGLAHGDREKWHELALIMAQEAEAWSRTTSREIHIGHGHRRRALTHVSVDTHQGVTVRMLPSLSSADAWHVGRGFLSTKAAESYLWRKKGGVHAFISSPG